MDATEPVIFDGHNDLLCRLWLAGGVEAAASFVEGRKGPLDRPKAEAGGFGGGFFAIYAASPVDSDSSYQAMRRPRYALPLPKPIVWRDAVPVAASQAATLIQLERMAALTICRNAADLRRTLMSGGGIAAVCHMEGAEAIDPDLNMLEVLYQAGLRSIGPVWSRETIFGHGVPFRFPSSPDIGDGLTDHGVRLVRRCNELGVLIDLSHLNEAGFWDVARLSTKPLVATHSNAHALCAHSRNLTDRQLRAIRESDGMVGLNFATAFLREDGRMMPDAPMSRVLLHLDYLIERLGEDRVGLGSDYEGALVPKALRTVADLPNLRRAMSKHGYGQPLIRKICHENWLRVLEKTWERRTGSRSRGNARHLFSRNVVRPGR